MPPKPLAHQLAGQYSHGMHGSTGSILLGDDFGIFKPTDAPNKYRKYKDAGSNSIMTEGSNSIMTAGSNLKSQCSAYSLPSVLPTNQPCQPTNQPAYLVVLNFKMNAYKGASPLKAHLVSHHNLAPTNQPGCYSAMRSSEISGSRC